MGCIPEPTKRVLASFSGTNPADGILVEPPDSIVAMKLRLSSSGVIVVLLLRSLENLKSSLGALRFQEDHDRGCPWMRSRLL